MQCLWRPIVVKIIIACGSGGSCSNPYLVQAIPLFLTERPAQCAHEGNGLLDLRVLWSNMKASFQYFFNTKGLPTGVRWANTLNPNKSGMPAATKGGACWRFFSNYCCTLPP